MLPWSDHGRAGIPHRPALETAPITYNARTHQRLRNNWLLACLEDRPTTLSHWRQWYRSPHHIAAIYGCLAR